jgi:hypothetical protein
MLTDEQGMMVKITYEDGEKKVLSTFNSREDRQYFIFQNLPTKETIIAKTKNDDLTMYGEVLRDGEVIVGELIILANSKGYPLDSAVTDADGQFSFRQLEEDDQYLIKMLTDEQGMLVKLVFKNDNNQVVRTLNSKEDRRYFIFQYLPSDETIASKVKNEDTAIFGEVLRNGEIIVGELIILTDTEGTPLDSTMTDANGKFTFRQLAGDENYLVKLLTDENGMLVKLEYQDEKGNVLKSLNSAEDQQYFAFNNLAQNQSHLAKMGNDDISISGEIISQAKEKQMVLLVDEQGNIVQSTTTDENGNFDFRNLPAGEEYTVWLDENDQGMTVVLNFKDKDNQVYRTLNSEQDKAFFEFKNLANFTSELSLIASTDDTKFKLVGNDKEQNFIHDLKQAMTYQYYESLEKKYGRQLLDEVNLRVQIGAYSKPQPDLFNYLKESEQVESESVNGLTKYLLGNFDILASAESLRQSAVDQGINDAFIAVYLAGKRVAILIY